MFNKQFALFFCSSALGFHVVHAQTQPNIILINIDDLGWTDNSYSSTYYETPCLDQLKAEGMYFPNAYAAAANSAPSRACLMTGQFTPRHGIYTVNPPERGDAQDRLLTPCANKSELSINATTLARVLNRHNYQTYHIGKWHLGHQPTQYGMDVNIGGNQQGHPKSYFSPYQNPDLKDGPIGENLTDRLGDELIRCIKKQDNSTRPFFIYYAPYAVHTPLQADPQLIAKYQNKQKSNQHNNPIYAAMLETIDRNLGKLHHCLDSLHLLENTLIFITSDNGGVYNISKQWPLRAGKGSFYEGGIRVPFIVIWKGKIPKGSVSQNIVSQVDIFPTLLAICNIPKEAYRLDGVNLQMVLTDDASLQDRSLFWHFPAYLEGGNKETRDTKFRSRPVSIIRKGDWKLLHHYEDRISELYNIKNDIGEQNNVVNANERIRDQLLSELERWLQSSNACIPTK